MKFSLQTGKLEKLKTQSLCIGIFEDDKNLSLIGDIGTKLRYDIKGYIKSGDFIGEKGQSFLFHNPKSSIKRIFLIGLGKQKDFDMEIFREIIALLTKMIKSKQYIDYTFYLQNFSKLGFDELAKTFTEVSEMCFYKFDRFKTKKEDDKKIKLREYSLFVDKANGKIKDACNIGMIFAQGNLLVRTLANTPSNELTPTIFANEAKKLAKENRLKITVLDEKDIIKKKMNLFAAVAKGSDENAKLAILEYKKGGSQKPIILVGKGITFDTGGINLKSNGYINTMKYDMAGAATVLSTIICAAKLKLKLNIIALCSLAENMPSGKAYKPDDVFTAYNKKTVEIGNTDAEGRLVLADTLSYCLEFKPRQIIDVATLTGAATYATGPEICPILGTDKQMIEDLKKASVQLGEKVWELPLPKEYEDHIKSEVADMKNIAEGPGPGTITAAIFLKNFVDDIPWVHIDIAGVGWTKTEKKYFSVGPTGFGARLLTQYLMDQSK